jgi:hypothetical protein
MRSDRLYEAYGKPVPYYFIIDEHHNDLMIIHNPITKDSLGALRSDLILISACKQ